MLTRPQAVTLALYALGADTASFDTEDVAMRVEKIAPGMFSWQKYPDRTDKELVRVALSDARLKAGLVIGSHSDGWMLTPKGLEFARENATEMKSGQVPKRRTRDDAQWQKERTRLMTSDAYQHYRNGALDAVTPEEADAFFRLNLYVTGETRDRKIARIENQFGDDPELGQLVKRLAQRARERDLTK